MSNQTHLLLVGGILTGLVLLVDVSSSGLAMQSKETEKKDTKKSDTKAIDDAFDRTPRLVGVTLFLKDPVAIVGEKVQMEAFVSRSLDEQVASMQYSIRRIGTFDAETQMLSLGERPSLNISKVDAGAMPGLTTKETKGPFKFPIIKGDKKGRKEIFEANRVGVFLIYAQWLMKDVWLQSAPVVLTVKPQVTELGKPIIKLEWLK